MFELPTTCPYCGRENDAQSPLGGANTPSEGSVAICWLCERISVFTEQLQLRKPTADELAEILADPGVTAALAAVSLAPTPTAAARTAAARSRRVGREE